MEDVPDVCRLALEDTNSERRGKLVLSALGAHSSVTQRSPWYPQQTGKVSQRVTHNLYTHHIVTYRQHEHQVIDLIPLSLLLSLLLVRTYLL